MREKWCSFSAPSEAISSGELACSVRASHEKSEIRGVVSGSAESSTYTRRWVVGDGWEALRLGGDWEVIEELSQQVILGPVRRWGG